MIGLSLACCIVFHCLFAIGVSSSRTPMNSFATCWTSYIQNFWSMPNAVIAVDRRLFQEYLVDSFAVRYKETAYVIMRYVHVSFLQVNCLTCEFLSIKHDPILGLIVSSDVVSMESSSDHVFIDLSLDIPQKFVNIRPGKGRPQCHIQGIPRR